MIIQCLLNLMVCCEQLYLASFPGSFTNQPGNEAQDNL